MGLQLDTTGQLTLIIVLKSESRSVVSDSLRPHGLYSPWNSPGQNTGVGSLSLLQEIIPTQGSNPGLPHCRQILYQLSHKGNSNLFKYSGLEKSMDCIVHGVTKNQTWLSNFHFIFYNKNKYSLIPLREFLKESERECQCYWWKKHQFPGPNIQPQYFFWWCCCCLWLWRW